MSLNALFVTETPVLLIVTLLFIKWCTNTFFPFSPLDFFFFLCIIITHALLYFLHRFWTGLNFFIYPILKLILFNEHPLREALLAYYYNHETLCIYLIRDDTLVSRSPSSGLFSCVEVVRSDVSKASHLRKSTRESVFKSPDLSVSSSHPDSPADQWTHLEKNKTNKQTTLQYTDLYSMHKMHWSWVYQLVCLKNKDGFYDAQVRKRRRRSSWNNIFAMWKRKKKSSLKLRIQTLTGRRKTRRD